MKIIQVLKKNFQSFMNNRGSIYITRKYNLFPLKVHPSNINPNSMKRKRKYQKRKKFIHTVSLSFSTFVLCVKIHTFNNYSSVLPYQSNYESYKFHRRVYFILFPQQMWFVYKGRITNQRKWLHYSICLLILYWSFFMRKG